MEGNFEPADEHIKYLHLALSRLSLTPPRLIVSPATQPRRAAVAIIIHITPPEGYSLPPPEEYEVPQTLEQLFAMDWVKQPGCVAELIYIRRRAPVGSSSGTSGSAPQQKQHVAFPGGRMEPGDEGEMYTAMRTTWEELGIDLAEPEWIPVGQMDDREITTSLGKRLLMILSPFVFIRATPYPLRPTPPEVSVDALNPEGPPAIAPPTIHSIPLPNLLSPSSAWSYMTIDISSRLAPLPHFGVWSRVFGNGKKKVKRRRVKQNEDQVSESAAASPTEGSVEEAVAITSSGASFWIWVMRFLMKFFVRTLVGDMRFSALILQGRVLPYGNEGTNEKDDGGYFGMIESSQDELKVWGLTLGMTLDLLSGMQPHLYNNTMRPTSAATSPTEMILDPLRRSNSVQQQQQPIFGDWSGAASSGINIPSVPARQQPGTRTRAASLSVSLSTDPNAPPAPRPSTPPISTAVNLQRSSSTGKFSADGRWVPTSSAAGSMTPGAKELVRHLEEEMKDMGGFDGVKTVWTPSMTCVFPRFSIPDVNFWIWVFGKRYRDVIRGWELSMRLGGSNDRRINWSGQALSAFYAAVRKALIVVIVLRVLGILTAVGLWSWWLYRRWS
ncbi:hypothetical protein FRB94_014197 [Tulasnella sp. JGI-2019a]|nr:hypothetical protein FRB93_005455 [Tulasnella sp. JGI-2019a]KAG9014105.1 hypothetical protein FRB94_014197 [Tulasnella sp. JGI-2019a]KAG9028792.1 hypothetical protein FRB95_006072 [Tulasnella sp. JGI-2019a]